VNYRLTSAILKSVWAIEPKAAIAHGSMLSLLLNDNISTLETEEYPKTYAASMVKGIYADYNDAPSGSVAVIPVIGELMKYSQSCGPIGMQRIGRQIQEADNQENISAIVLNIDSPGGTVDGTETLANIVKQAKKPVVTFVDGMMCSAALWIGTSADYVFASLPNDEIGSIGVMISFADMQPYWEKQGVKFHKIRADQSKDKNEVFYQALDGKYDQIKEEMLNPLADSFIKAVKENRPDVAPGQLTGKVFFAKDVIGTLIDEIGSLNDAIDKALSLVKPNIKTIKI